MNKMLEIGFWLDSVKRVGGMLGNAFRWVFATKRRLQLVILGLIILATLWGCSRAAVQREEAASAPKATATATPTGASCAKPAATTDAEKAAAEIAFRSCSVPNYQDTRRSAASRALTITLEGSTPQAPAPEVAQRFSDNLPNAMQQIGGADENGITTVLATSSRSKFLMGFSATGELASVKDITETADVAPAQGTTKTPQGTASPTPTPTPTR